ncbi:MAG: amino acid adenylation domain-containing protein, partial [bacterium]|nr:amino acid adenylation domain-containing protein [bacterium]
SSAQRRMYLLQQMEPGNTVYNMPEMTVLGAEVDKQALEKVFKQLIRRHESFRTSFGIINEEPVQRIRKAGIREQGFGISVGAGSPRPGEFVRPFDLTRAPLLRVELVQTEDGNHVLLVDMHHIISDGVSTDILIKEFVQLYRGGTLPLLRFRYKDYAAWQAGRAYQKMLKIQEDYWLKELSGEIPVLKLPFDYLRPVVRSFEGGDVLFIIEGEETALLKQLASEHGVTIFMLLAAVYFILLSRVSGQEDIVVGTPIAGRRHADLEGIIGMFVNMLILRNYPSGAKSFIEFLLEVKKQTLRAFDNQDYHFEDLVETMTVSRDPGRSPLFDAVFTWVSAESAPRGDVAEEKSGTVETGVFDDRVSKFDMTWSGYEYGDRFIMGVEYCTRLFKKETIERFIAYTRNIISAAVSNPHQKISGIEILSEEEKRQLLYDFNFRDGDYPNDKTIHQLFEEQATQTPDRVAVSGGAPIPGGAPIRDITYAELNEIANRLTGYLLIKGVKAGELVGIMADRSPGMIIGLLGILKTGCGYVPLDPNAPEERKEYILSECRVKVLLTTRHLYGEGGILTGWTGKVYLIEGAGVSAAPRIPRASASSKSSYSSGRAADTAYVIFTSGSTGKPKGVPITHANLSPLLHWGYKHLGINETDRFYQNLSYYFDWSVWEIFIALTSGARLYMVPESLQVDPARSVAFMNENRVTVLHVTPTQHRYFLSVGERLETLKYLFLGAEALSVDLVERSFQSVNEQCRVFNMYGPTEATILAAVLEVERNGIDGFRGLSSVPIGGPVGNTELLILDNHFNLCPVNVVGELYIGGDGLSTGYLNNPELTADRFLNKSFVGVQGAIFQKSPRPPEACFYKTGDLARWLPPPAGGPSSPAGAPSKGTIEFLGRIDFQVKIRGYRIELGEIESSLVQYPGVKEAVVLAKDKADKADQDKYLCAYIVPSDAGSVDIIQLKEHLSHFLPEYMIPAHYVNIDSIPLNPNGKVDRKALPEPEAEAGVKYEPPRNETERKITAVWSGILGMDKETIGIDDNFFDCGGHSLKASVLASKIQKEFRVTMPLVEMFASPTVRQLAQYVDRHDRRDRLAAKEDETAVFTRDHENLVLLREEGPRAGSLFFIHDGSGEVEGYIEFCRRLDLPVNCWGLRADRLHDYAPRNLTISELARQYIKKIKSVQPRGPYFIAGWSIGGTIAFEMVRQLEQEGESAGTLFLIDAYAPFDRSQTHPFTFQSELNLARSGFSLLPGSGGIETLNETVEIRQVWPLVVGYLEENGIGAAEVKKAIPENMLQSMPGSISGAGIREYIYYMQVIRTLDRARDIYRADPSQKIESAVYFFAASGTEGMNKEEWPSYFKRPVSFFDIGGDHFSIFKAPDVDAFARTFSRVEIWD